jgi:hypothetical protein
MRTVECVYRRGPRPPYTELIALASVQSCMGTCAPVVCAGHCRSHLWLRSELICGSAATPSHLAPFVLGLGEAFTAVPLTPWLLAVHTDCNTQLHLQDLVVCSTGVHGTWLRGFSLCGFTYMGAPGPHIGHRATSPQWTCGLQAAFPAVSIPQLFPVLARLHLFSVLCAVRWPAKLHL